MVRRVRTGEQGEPFVEREEDFDVYADARNLADAWSEAQLVTEGRSYVRITVGAP